MSRLGLSTNVLDLFRNVGANCSLSESSRRVRLSVSQGRCAAVMIASVSLLGLHGVSAAQTWCVPGGRLNVSSYGHWYPATARSSSGEQCLVHYDAFSSSSDERVGADRAAPLGSTTPFSAGGSMATRAPGSQQGGGASPKSGRYHCTLFAHGALVTVPGFTVAGSSYRHDNGGGGGIRPAQGMVEFVGGPLSGQAAKVEPGILRIFNEKRTRTVIDCESR